MPDSSATCSERFAFAAIGMRPPHERAAWIVGGSLLVLADAWFAGERRRFQGAPRISE